MLIPPALPIHILPKASPVIDPTVFKTILVLASFSEVKSWVLPSVLKTLTPCVVASHTSSFLSL